LPRFPVCFRIFPHHFRVVSPYFFLFSFSKANKFFCEAYESVLAWFRRRRIKHFHRTARSPLGDQAREEKSDAKVGLRPPLCGASELSTTTNLPCLKSGYIIKSKLSTFRAKFGLLLMLKIGAIIKMWDKLKKGVDC